MRRAQLRARGPRHTHGLVQMVREQVAVLVEGTGTVAREMAATSRRMDDVAKRMAQLGVTVNRLLERVDAQEERADDHEARIVKLEKKKRGGGK